MEEQMKIGLLICFAAILCLMTVNSWAAWMEYGDEGLFYGNTYSSDPKSGATLEGLATDISTKATLIENAGFTFPAVPDYPGTDTIYIGSTVAVNGDGYWSISSKNYIPQEVSFDYSSLLPSGNKLETLTLGIAGSDFQFSAFNNPFYVWVNGIRNTTLESVIEGLDVGGPMVQFFTIGIDPNTLLSSNILNLKIDEGGNGGDGWAVDYFTVGVTSSPKDVPEPSSIFLALTGFAGIGGFRIFRRK
jgi:hypothetical protein